jgi:simple sugar transport system permease protein
MSQAYVEPKPPGLPLNYQPPAGVRTRDWSFGGLLWPAACLALLLLYNFVTAPGFFHITRMADGRLYGSVIDILNRSAPLTLISLGMTLVIATGGVDLSVGAIVAIAGAVAASLISHSPDSPLAGINAHGSVTVVVIAALLVGLIAGLWNGVLVAILDVQPIIATLILMVAGRGVAQLLTGGQVITFENRDLEFFGTGFKLGLPFPIFIVLAAAILTGILARRTALGLFVESVGNNPTASHYAGVNARLVKLAVYAFCGVCAAMAGIVVTADIKAADASNAGVDFELDAILAASIGGTALVGGRFSLLGSIIGALLIQTLTTTILTKGVPRPATLVIKALVIVAVCLLQSESFRSKFFSRLRRKGS